VRAILSIEEGALGEKACLDQREGKKGGGVFIPSSVKKRMVTFTRGKKDRIISFPKGKKNSSTAR